VTTACLASSLPVATAREWALVLEAVGVPYRLERTPAGAALWVDPMDHARAADELGRYLRENRTRPAPGLSWPVYRHAGWGVAAYAVILVLVMAAALYHVGDRNWVNRGVLQTGITHVTDWWRVFTALTLHANLPHLLGNMAFGVVFAYPASQFVGVGVAWLAIVLGAGTANTLDMLLHAPGEEVLGASTAVFVALGLASAFSWRRRTTGSLTWRQRLAPLVAGVALLAFTGTGGEHTDVLAHLLGFGVGVGTGFALAHLPLPAPARSVPQWIAGTLALAILAAAWLAALQ